MNKHIFITNGMARCGKDTFAVFLDDIISTYKYSSIDKVKEIAELCGWNGSRYTVQDHPLLAAKWVLETKVEHDIPMEYKQMIADMCEAHSGEWNKSRSGQVIMSEPRNHREFFIHECDILASRADLGYVIPDELKGLLGENVKVELPDLDTYVLTFGKHNGKTLPQIAECDSGWIVWVKENINREPVRTLLAQM